MANTKNSIYLSPDLQDYLEKESERYGMGKSSFISMVLSMYRHEMDAMSHLSKFDEYIARFEKLVDSQPDK